MKLGLCLFLADITLSSLHSHYSHRTSANMVLGPGGPSSGYQSHARPENRHQSSDVSMDYDQDKRLRTQSKAKRKRRRNMITANLSGTRYEVSKYTYGFIFKHITSVLWDNICLASNMQTFHYKKECYHGLEFRQSK